MSLFSQILILMGRGYEFEFRCPAEDNDCASAVVIMKQGERVSFLLIKSEETLRNELAYLIENPDITPLF